MLVLLTDPLSRGFFKLQSDVIILNEWKKRQNVRFVKALIIKELLRISVVCSTLQLLMSKQKIEICKPVGTVFKRADLCNLF